MMVVVKLLLDILEIIFLYLSIFDFRNCLFVCKFWYKYLNDEDNDVWWFYCVRKLVEEVLKFDLLKNVLMYKVKFWVFYYVWNFNDCLKNMYVKFNGFLVYWNLIV